MRKQIAAANWKMNLTLAEAETLVSSLLEDQEDLKEHQLVIFGVPFPYLHAMKQKVAAKKNYFIAAQNVHFQKSGAYTGEVCAAMLNSVDTDYVIIGHSERREYFDEDHQMLADKIDACLQANLKPVFCCGEPLSIREAQTQNAHVQAQLQESLFHLTAEQLTDFVIAYEPVWAIGTGKTATSLQAQQMHAHIRNVIAQKYGAAVSESISILYGGSVKAANAKEIFGEKDVDGGLVGGASLNAEEFRAIIKALK